MTVSTQPTNARLEGFAGLSFMVHDLDQSLLDWASMFGAGPFFKGEFELEGHIYRGKPGKVHTEIALAYSGDTLLEMVAVRGEGPSIFHEVLDRGEGLHHFWVVSEDFDGDIAKYEKRGFPLVAHGPVPGIGRIGFVDATSRLGGLIKVAELDATTYENFAKVKRHHQQWDGKNPIRSMSSI